MTTKADHNRIRHQPIPADPPSPYAQVSDGRRQLARLSDFAQRLGGTYAAEDMLPQMAHTVAADWRRPGGGVVRVGDQLRPEASSDGGPPAGPLPVDGHQLSQLPDSDTSVPVMHQGELLGAISVEMPKDEPLRVAGQQLVADVASQAGLVLSNVGLIEDLRASRQRLVTAQDEARRRLERNIHDGARQDLVALAIKLRLANMTGGGPGADPADPRRSSRADDRGRAGEPARPRPGHLPAATGRPRPGRCAGRPGQQVPAAVTVEADRNGRFGQDVEAAVYFCCLEALRHRQYATPPGPHLPADAGRYLEFHHLRRRNRIQHKPHSDGLGPQEHGRRLAALGGQLKVRSAPGQGTTITGYVPVPSRTPARTSSHEVCHIRTRNRRP